MHPENDFVALHLFKAKQHEDIERARMSRLAAQLENGVMRRRNLINRRNR